MTAAGGIGVSTDDLVERTCGRGDSGVGFGVRSHGGMTGLRDAVISKLPPHGDLQLYLLSDRHSYWCAHCATQIDARAVATTGGDWTRLACPTCYTAQTQALRPPPPSGNR